MNFRFSLKLSWICSKMKQASQGHTYFFPVCLLVKSTKQRHYFPLLYCDPYIIKKPKYHWKEAGRMHECFIMGEKIKWQCQFFSACHFMSWVKSMKIQTFGLGSATWLWVLEEVKLPSLALLSTCVIQKYFMVAWQFKTPATEYNYDDIPWSGIL
jgi:hypothetical protein